MKIGFTGLAYQSKTKPSRENLYPSVHFKFFFKKIDPGSGFFC